ncbi:TonB C-terminal domain-containing protein [Candidimonas humi]|uniref:Energy transducer TonB n=1 Tax=Candidimonas humi TaxID=683355 RepID=A0ABV8P3C6_9BURK|nr:energy transducer TonB [Candidimonas humi]MBV6306776.1 TonB C-terminal domain-containing protein [Candidimonas humi]
MSILWRFVWCIAAITWAGNTVANPVSGAYLRQGADVVQLLQITAKNDGGLRGTITRNKLQSDGSISRESVAITGVIDGRAITIIAGLFVRSSSLSGTIDGASGHKVIALAVADGVARYTESDLDQYQAALHGLEARGEAIRKQRHTSPKKRHTAPPAPAAPTMPTMPSNKGDMMSYATKVRACIRPRVAYPVPPRTSENPAVTYRATLDSHGMVENVEIKRSSGVSGFDRAVTTGVKNCSPFPKPPSGEYPSYVDGSYRMYD